MFWLYNLLIFFTAPIWIPWMVIRSRRRKEQPNWRERFGDFGFQLQAKTPRVWIHAVSVGEVVAALPILQAIKRAPDAPEIVLSVTTSSGYQTARDRASEWVDRIVYFPIDVPLFQFGGLTRVRPRVVAIMETELWFNFLYAAKLLDATTMLVNGRISDRSFPRSRRLRFFYKSLLRLVDRCLMQTPTDADRIQALGARPESVAILGNCKYDQALLAPKKSAEQWRKELGIESDQRVIVIGSTREPEEDELVISALQRVLGPGVTVIYAPRHLERADAIAALWESKIGTPMARRSQKETGPVLLLDTYGELGEVYQLAHVAVIGGGFAPTGGQNLIQPLGLGVPVLHGPHMQNFAEATRAALNSGASRECSDAESLAQALSELLKDPDVHGRMSEAARAMTQSSLGASQRYADAILAAVRANPGFQRKR